MLDSYVYVPREWVDHIIELDEHGNPVIDSTTGKPKVLQEGTRHKAAFENNQEQGILKSHQRLDEQARVIQRMQVQLELDGRAPGNSGTFADTFDDTPNKLMRLTTIADITQAVAAGTTELPVDSVEGFEPFTEVTVFDGTNSEDVLITAVGTTTITVQAITKSYVKGARVARSTAAIVDGQMVVGEWGTYGIRMEVV